LNRGEDDVRGNRVVVSAGTGLGEAALVWNGAQIAADLIEARPAHADRRAR
jgi:glucokinase